MRRKEKLIEKAENNFFFSNHFLQWQIITKALCCGTGSASKMTYENVREDIERNVTAHPSDEQIGLTAHKPMYPPGRIILVVRNHPQKKKYICLYLYKYGWALF